MSVINTFIVTIVLSLIAEIFACLAGRMLGKACFFVREGGLEENTGVYGIINAIISLFRFIPYILILLLLYLPLKNYVNGSVLIVVSIFIELLPMFTHSTHKALNKVPQDVIDAAVAMGSNPDEIINYFIYPEAADEIKSKTIRLLFYGLLCAITAQLWISLR